MVLASRRHRLAPPLDSAHPTIGDIEGLRVDAENARAIGFGGKACVHPEQLKPIAAAFVASEEQIVRARAILAAFEVAERRGQGATTLDGQLIDYPVADRAAAVLAAAGETTQWQRDGRNSR
jgi:citrate lyase subunit beta/citryl-CoA lyase